MADITKCKGKDCIVKDECYRYTTKSKGPEQDFFIEDSIFKIVDSKFTCDAFFGEDSNLILNNIKDILK